ncbi:MAG: YlbF family regulator [Clostridia bacterium]
MNVYDTANKLAKEIHESKEYKEYKKAKEKVDSNPELKQKIKDFEKIRYDVQMLSVNVDPNSQTPEEKVKAEEKAKKLQEMYAILVENREIKEYFDIEVKFNVLLADVNKIIAESVRDVLM